MAALLSTREISIFNHRYKVQVSMDTAIETKGETSGFLVIGTGLSRTGTASLKTALEILLQGKCHNGFQTYEHEAAWIDVLNGTTSDEELETLLLSNGYVAGVGIPFYLIYERLMKIFPNAKVILTVRDPEEWVTSFNNTLYEMTGFNWFSPLSYFLYYDLFTTYLADNIPTYPCTQLFPSNKIIKAFDHVEQFRVMMKMLDKGNGVEFFNDHTKRIEESVPVDKLLKFDVREGWEPLCKHLNVPIPNVPFPNSNSTAEFAITLARNRRRAWLLLYELISIPVIVYMVCTMK